MDDLPLGAPRRPQASAGFADALRPPVLPNPLPNVAEYTVSELSGALKRSIEQGFSHVRVRGEVSGFKRHGSGHCYLCLKDSEAAMDAVIWRQAAMRIGLRAEDGMEVVCTGRLTTFPGRSKYQLVIESMELAGKGALLKLLEERRARLGAEGLFAAERKKKIPFLPAVIGVVTSPSGAVIRDILHRLADRFPRHVLLWPVAVQGDGAAAQVAAAIEGFNRLVPGGKVPRPDLLIVARGGGSLEDLMPFNEEIVVRAAAASRIPLISAVGHETDTTLIDHASDRRAPTPSAAAEMAVPVRLDLAAELGAKSGRLSGALSRFFGERRLHVTGLARGLPQPTDLIGNAVQRLDDRAERLRLAQEGILRHARQKLAAARLTHPGVLLQQHSGEVLRLQERLAGALSIRFVRFGETFGHVAARLRPGILAAELEAGRRRVAEAEPRLAAGVLRVLAQAHASLDNFAGRLATHCERHESLLSRGYVVVRDAQDRVLTEAAQIRPGAVLELEFAKDRLGVVAGAKPRQPRRRLAPLPGQGSLF